MTPSYLRQCRSPRAFAFAVATSAAFQLCRRLLRGIYS